MPRRARKPSRKPPRLFPQDNGKPWGMRVVGMFLMLDKRPMLEAGLGPPPFTLTLADGRQVSIVSQEPGDEIPE